MPTPYDNALEDPASGSEPVQATPLADPSVDAAQTPSASQAVPGAAGNLGQVTVSVAVMALWGFSVIMEAAGVGTSLGEGTRQLLMTAVTLVLGFWLGSSSSTGTSASVAAAAAAARVRSAFR